LHGIKAVASASSSRNATAAAAAQLPKSGVYASTDLLRVVQQQMLWATPQVTGSNASAAAPAVYSTRDNRLIAYLSATDLLQGEGWKARAAFFVFLLAPRYVLTSTGGKFAPELQLLDLASKDLPAVGLLQRSEVRGTVGVCRWHAGVPGVWVVCASGSGGSGAAHPVSCIALHWLWCIAGECAGHA
jgi:hypothetical protein